MDFIRFEYETEMRLVADQPGVPVRWFRCAPQAKGKPEGFGYGSRIWEDDWRHKEDTGQFGEIYGLKPTWLTPTPPPASICHKGPHWPERYRPGVPAEEAYTYPVLRMDAQGWPVCCCHPCQFVPAYLSDCNQYWRYTERIRWSIDTPQVGQCPDFVGFFIDLFWNGTYWHGERDWVVKGNPVTIAADFQFPAPGCLVLIYYLDPPDGGGMVAGDAVINPNQPELKSINPLRISWVRQSLVPSASLATVAVGFTPFDIFNWNNTLTNYVGPS